MADHHDMLGKTFFAILTEAAPDTTTEQPGAESFEEARGIADTDPFHAQGLRNYTVERWTVNEGSYTVRLTYSDQRLALD